MTFSLNERSLRCWYATDWLTNQVLARIVQDLVSALRVALCCSNLRHGVWVDIKTVASKEKQQNGCNSICSPLLNVIVKHYTRHNEFVNGLCPLGWNSMSMAAISCLVHANPNKTDTTLHLRPPVLWAQHRVLRNCTYLGIIKNMYKHNRHKHNFYSYAHICSVSLFSERSKTNYKTKAPHFQISKKIINNSSI